MFNTLLPIIFYEYIFYVITDFIIMLKSNNNYLIVKTSKYPYKFTQVVP